jgi:hypothetical protein
MTAPLILYGYTIAIPEDDSLAFIRDMISINDTLADPIQVFCITPSPSVDDVQVIIGFIPDNRLSGNMIHLDTLRELIIDNPMFDGIDMNKKPAFYAGYQWEDVESDTESVTESVTESGVESDVESEDSDLSDTSDKTDDETISDETNDKPISYYVSKYYI